MSATGGTIHDVSRQYRERLAQAEGSALRDLEAAYRVVWGGLEEELIALEPALGGGTPISADALRREARVRALLAQVEGEIDRVAGDFAPTLTALQAQASVLGRAATLAQLAAAGITLEAALPNLALIDLVGRLQDGSPLRSLLDELGPDAARRVESALIGTLGRGIGPRRAIPSIREALGGNMARAETIARTEIVGAYRRASWRQAQERKDVLDGWTWSAAIDSPDQPCVVCWSMHGSFHSLDESLDSHPRCRCAQIFTPKDSMIDLGPSGEDVFTSLDDAEQRRILGPAAHDLYRDGRITLADLVEPVDHPRWGPGLRRRSLESLGYGRLAS